MKSLPEDKASFGSAPAKFWQFVSKCVFWNLATIVANQGYHYDRGIEWNLLEPRVATKNSLDIVDQRHYLTVDPRSSIAGNGSSPRRMQLGSHCLVSSEAPRVVRAMVGWVESIDWHLAMSMLREERERDRDRARDRVRDSGRNGERERGVNGGGCWQFSASPKLVAGSHSTRPWLCEGDERGKEGSPLSPSENHSLLFFFFKIINWVNLPKSPSLKGENPILPFLKHWFLHSPQRNFVFEIWNAAQAPTKQT